MAGRIRSIKPELLTDAKAVRLSDTAWRCWVSCWLLADDTGRLPGDPAIVGGQVFPLKPVKADAAIVELIQTGLVTGYSVRGEPYLQITGFAKHQKINRPSGPKFPSPADGDCILSEPSLNAHGVLTEGSVPISISTAISTTTASASDGPAKQRRASPEVELPEGWGPSSEHAEMAGKLKVDLAGEATKFRLHAESTGRKQKRWNAAFSLWLHRASEYAKSSPQGRLTGRPAPNEPPVYRVEDPYADK